MKTKLTFLLFLILIISSANYLYSQQDPMFAQYRFNKMSINPAYAGSKEHVCITAISRSQWVGIKGAPQTQTLTAHAPYRDVLGGGITLIRDQAGPVNYYAVNFSAAYKLIFDNNSVLSIGVRLGYSNLNIRLMDVEGIDPEDFAFQNNLNSLQPVIGGGLLYYSDNFYIGASMPDIIENDYQENDLVWKKNRHYFFTAGYNLNVIDGISIRPSVMTRYVQNAPVSIEATGKIVFNNAFGAGLLYRVNDAIGAVFTMQIIDNLMMGYSYDYSISMLRGNQTGSHEIMLNYCIGIPERTFASPRYF